jgi:uroporphyrinogen-III decarboxylase
MDISLSVYEHAAKLVNRTPWEASRDEETMFQAHVTAYRLYQHNPIVPGIDIYNLEVEAYGAKIQEPEGFGIPAVGDHPFAETEKILQLSPFDPSKDGRISMLLRVARRLKEVFPEAQIRVPVSGPFSIAGNLIGLGRLAMDVALSPDLVAEALLHLSDGQLAFAHSIRDAGVNIAFFESAACPPLLSPKMFRRIELPALKRIMTGIEKITGTTVPCIIGGNTYPILEAMIETGTTMLICPIETDQFLFMEKMKEYPDIMVRINCDFRVIASGTPEQIDAEADRVVALGRGRNRVCIGTGALPYETPTENVFRFMERVRSA